MLRGPATVTNGGPEPGVSEPLPLSIEKAEMLFDPVFITYKKAPAESMTRSCGTEAAGATDVLVDASVKVPSLAMVNMEMSFSAVPPCPGFATYRNFPEGWITRERAPSPTEYRLPEICVSTPELGSSR